MNNFEEPSSKLSPFIERYWWKHLSSEISLSEIYPSTGAELTFHFKCPLYRSTSLKTYKTSTVSLLYNKKSSVKLTVKDSASFLSIRFRTGMLHHFLPNNSLTSLSTITDASEIFGNNIYVYHEKLLFEKNPLKQKKIVEDFLLEMLHKNYKNDIHIDYLSKLLYYKCNELNVNEVAYKVGYSRRQLQRICYSNYGVSPKNYLSIARFNRTLKQLLFSDDKSLLSQALDGGYFDQAHFIHSFKNMTGLSPKEFFYKVNRMSHFYNTSLASSSYIATTV